MWDLYRKESLNRKFAVRTSFMNWTLSLKTIFKISDAFNCMSSVFGFCQLCEKHYSTHDWTVHLCWFEKKTSRCQKYLEISSFMLNFGKPLTKIFSVLFKNVYHCPTQSWHGGSAHRKAILWKKGKNKSHCKSWRQS